MIWGTEHLRYPSDCCFVQYMDLFCVQFVCYVPDLTMSQTESIMLRDDKLWSTLHRGRQHQTSSSAVNMSAVESTECSSSSAVWVRHHIVHCAM